MSILIKNMKMPKNCWDCRFELNNMCRATINRMRVESCDRHPDCPLIEVPKHGRLIDADALEDYCHRQTKNKWNESTQTSWAYAYASFESDVEDAPTIIESER